MKCHFSGQPDLFSRMRALFTEPPRLSRWQQFTRWFWTAYKDAQQQKAEHGSH